MTTLALMVIMITSAAAMSFSKARKEALFLSDKMAYELSLSLSQYEAVYEINLDYFLGLYDPVDLDGVYWLRRNADLRYVLSEWQWLRYTTIPDFYRPMTWVRRHTFSLVLRNRYLDAAYFYYDRPAVYYNFRGGHNTGHVSFYADRDFHRPAAPGATMHYGSSSPASHGTTRGSGKGTASYHIGNAGGGGGGNARPNTDNARPNVNNNGGNARPGSTRGSNSTQYNADAHHSTTVTQPATTTTRPESFSGSQRGATRSTTTPATTPAQTTRSNNNNSTTTSRGGNSGSSRSNSGSTRGNNGGSRGR